MEPDRSFEIGERSGEAALSQKGRRGRARFLAGMAASSGLAIARFPAGAAEFTYKYANDAPLTLPLGQAAVWWADQVKQHTGGQMEIQVFPNGQLGGSAATFTQLRAGAIQFFHYGGTLLGDFVHAAALEGVPFAFTNTNDVFKAMDGEMGAYIRGEIGKAGLFAFNRAVDSGFREITNSLRPINTPADLKGMKFRVPTTKIWLTLFTALGTSPVTLSLSEVYVALQTHLADGQENPLLTIEESKFYEVQKYCSLTNHSWGGWWCLANADAWNKLPKRVQDIVVRVYDQSVDRQRDASRKFSADLEPKLRAQGLTFTRPDIPSFRAALRTSGYYAQWKEIFGDQSWAMLEKYSGKLA